MFAGARFQGSLNRAAGGVGDMRDPAVAVAALAGQVIIHVAVGVRFLGEGDAPRAKPFDHFPAMLHRQAHCIGMAQTRAGDQSILQVGFDGIAGVQYRRHPTLGVIRAAFGQRSLGQHHDAGGIGHTQRQAQTGGAAADDQNIRGKRKGGHGL